MYELCRYIHVHSKSISTPKKIIIIIRICESLKTIILSIPLCKKGGDGVKLRSMYKSCNTYNQDNQIINYCTFLCVFHVTDVKTFK